MAETYTIMDPDNTRFGRCLGIVTDALTGRRTAHYAGGYTVVIGEPLCGGCDAPASDCGCEESFQVEQVA